MTKSVQCMGVRVLQGTKAYELLTSSDPKERASGKKLVEFGLKAEACFYQNPEYAALRQKYLT